MNLDIHLAGATDIDRIAGLIARAFHPLAVARWLVPDEIERMRMFPDYFAILVEHAVPHGLVHTTAERDAVAIWLPHTDGPPAPMPDYDERLAVVSGAWRERFTAFDALLTDHHPSRPHHYLAFLAVRPDRQGRGLGTMLLNHHHTHLDEAGLPAYLEASSRSSRALYLRQGYQPHGHPLILPNGPLLWPLLREPGNLPDPGWLVQAGPGIRPGRGMEVNHDYTTHRAASRWRTPRGRPAHGLP